MQGLGTFIDYQIGHKDGMLTRMCRLRFIRAPNITSGSQWDLGFATAEEKDSGLRQVLRVWLRIWA